MADLWCVLPGDDNERAEFYSLGEPYECRTVMVTATDAAKRLLSKMKKEAEARERERGLVPFVELPAETQEYWVRVRSGWLVEDVLQHLESRQHEQ